MAIVYSLDPPQSLKKWIHFYPLNFLDLRPIVPIAWLWWW